MEKKQVENFSLAPITLPQGVKKVLSRFYENKAEAYLVGGCVRDYILKRKTDDFDITTALTPQEVKALFSDMRVLETGIKHGTVTVVAEGLPIEITTYRVDGGYLDSRHPNEVLFSSSLIEDLKRRDFTINTICYNENEGFLDHFGGKEDIKNKIIKTVGAPEKRLSEDALRILRGIRFASVLGFSIEKETKEAIFSKAYLVKKISVERVFVEIKKLLLGDFATKVLEEYFSVLKRAILPLSKIESEKIDFSAVSKVEKNLPLRISSFIICLGGDKSFAKQFLEHLKSDNKTKQAVLFLTDSFYKNVPKTKFDIKSILNKAEEQDFLNLVSLLYAFERITDEEKKKILKLLNEIIENKECYSLKSLNINGEELLRLGVRDKQIGEILNSLLTSVMADEIKNTKSELEEKAQNILGGNVLR